MKRFCFAFFILLSFATVSQATDIVSWYPFNGNANDESGSGNHGTVYGALIEEQSDRFGIDANAYLFDGNNDYIIISDSSSLDFTTSFTISAWINITDFSGSSWSSDSPNIISKGYSNYEPYRLEIRPSGIVLWVANSTSNRDGQMVSVTVPTGQWIHIAVTYNAGAMAFYLNGNLIGTRTSTISSLYNTAGPVYIGTRKPNYNTIKGKVDDVRLVGNRALTKTEILSLYTGKPPVNVINVGDGKQIRLEWLNAGFPTTAYWVGRRTPGNPWAWFEAISNPSQSQQVFEFIDTNVVKETTYEYQVYAEYVLLGQAQNTCRAHVVLVQGFFNYNANDYGYDLPWYSTNFTTSAYWADFTAKLKDDEFYPIDTSCRENLFGNCMFYKGNKIECIDSFDETQENNPAYVTQYMNNHPYINGMCDPYWNGTVLKLKMRERFINAAPTEQISIVAHSMGALIARDFLFKWNNLPESKKGLLPKINMIISLAGVNAIGRIHWPETWWQFMQNNMPIFDSNSTVFFIDYNNLVAFNGLRQLPVETAFHRASGKPYTTDNLFPEELNNEPMNDRPLETFWEVFSWGQNKTKVNTGEFDNDGGPYVLQSLYGITSQKVVIDIKNAEVLQCQAQCPPPHTTECENACQVSGVQSANNKLRWFSHVPRTDDVTFLPFYLAHDAMKYHDKVYREFVRKLLQGIAVPTYYYNTYCTDDRIGYGFDCPDYALNPLILPEDPQRMSTAYSASASTESFDALPRMEEQTFLNAQETIVAGQTVTHTVQIDTAGYAIFTIIAENEVQTMLVSPAGHIIDTENTEDGSFIKDTYGSAVKFTWKIFNPEPGLWSVRLTGGKAIPSGTVYTVAIDATSNLTLTTFAGKNVKLGNAVLLTAKLQDGIMPIAEATVTAEILSTTDTVTDRINLYDDGEHFDGEAGDGLFANIWEQARDIGPHTVFLSATGVTDENVAFERNAQTRFVIYTETISIDGDYTDKPLDANGDGIFDKFRISFDVTVKEYTRASIIGVLTDAEGNKVAVGSYEFKQADKNKGRMRVSLDFAGEFIHQSGKNSPYYLKYIGVFDEFQRATVQMSEKVDDYRTTGIYDHVQFQQ